MINFKRIVYSIICFFLLQLSIVIKAQEINLPKGFAKGEEKIMSDYIQSIQLNSKINFPTRALRAPAEWEEMQAVFISWKSYPSILKEIVRNLVNECKVIIASSDTNSTKSYLSSNAIDPIKNITHISYNTNSVWMRDYGPNTVYQNEIDSLSLVDWIYNRPRPNDDSFSVFASRKLNIPLYQTLAAPFDLVHTGGNFMSDGQGIGFSSSLVEDENGMNSVYGTSTHDLESINKILNQYMGINSYVIMDKLPFDGIHHIDMHMKLLDETHLLVGKYPDGMADGPQIEANIQYILSNYKTKTNKAFKVQRIPMPPDKNNNYPDKNGSYRTYANALIINKTILVPTYDPKYDSIALRVWKEIRPGYKIIGINCESMISASGAIHCITKELGVDQPLLIQHEELDDVAADHNGNYLAQAMIRHTSGISHAELFYKLSSETNFVKLEMNRSSSNGNLWEANIPMQIPGSEIQYYIYAMANDSKSQLRPMPAPESYFHFKILLPTSNINLENIFEEKVFPNPARSITCIPTRLEAGQRIKLSLTDLFGKEILEIYNGIQNEKDQKYFIDAKKLISGIYYIQVQTQRSHLIQTLVVE